MERMLRTYISALHGLSDGSLLKTLASALLLALAPTSCTLINDDRSDCERHFLVRYEVTLRTNLTTEVSTVLRSRSEDAVADLLEQTLGTVFREYATDVDLSFYAEGMRRHHEQHTMNAGQEVVELVLPAADYRHLALANIAEEAQVSMADADAVGYARLVQAAGDTIDSHATGLFTAREDMDVHIDADQSFAVNLYMANSASVLVICTDNVDYRQCRVVSTDFADGFMVSDSLYTRATAPVVRDRRIDGAPANREVFYAVTFPSCDTAAEAQAQSRADSQTGSSDAGRIWRKQVFVTMPDGSITRTVVNVSKPLRAGQAAVIYAYMKPDGSIVSPNVDVTTSVQLNWREGLIIK